MTTAYLTRNYTLPIPALKIELRNGENGPTLRNLKGIVDTGADMTIIPTGFLRRLKTRPVASGQLRGQWGDLHPVDFYILDLIVEHQVMPGIRVAGDDSANEILIGRNLLNKLAIFLDGPTEHAGLLSDSLVNRLRY